MNRPLTRPPILSSPRGREIGARLVCDKLPFQSTWERPSTLSHASRENRLDQHSTTFVTKTETSLNSSRRQMREIWTSSWMVVRGNETNPGNVGIRTVWYTWSPVQCKNSQKVFLYNSVPTTTERSQLELSAVMEWMTWFWFKAFVFGISYRSKCRKTKFCDSSALPETTPESLMLFQNSIKRRNSWKGWT